MLLNGTVQPGNVTTGEYGMSIRLERLRVREALNARDVAVNRLADACASVREKAAALEALREEKEALERRFDAALVKHDGSRVFKEIGEANVEIKREGTTDIRRQLASCVKTIEDRLASLKIMEDSVSGMVAIDEIESDYKVRYMHYTRALARPHTLRLSSSGWKRHSARHLNCLTTFIRPLRECSEIYPTGR